MRSLPSHIVFAAALATLANTVLSHRSAHVKNKTKAAPIFYRSQRMEQPLLADVPACHVHKHNHTVRFHVPSASVTPRSWHDARHVPLSAWAGDCHAESDSFPRSISNGDAKSMARVPRVHSATCCCTFWDTATLPQNQNVPPDASCSATFGSVRLKRAPHAPNCRVAVLLSGRLFPGWVGAFDKTLRSVRHHLLPALPQPSLIFVAMESSAEDQKAVTATLEGEPVVAAYSIELAGNQPAAARAVQSCTNGAFSKLYLELGQRHAPRRPPETTVSMYRHIYLVFSLLEQFEATRQRSVLVEHVLRARIDHYIRPQPLDWKQVLAASNAKDQKRPHGALLIGSAAAHKVEAKQRAGVSPALRCTTYDTFAVGPRALMKRYASLYPSLRDTLHLQPIWRWDWDSMESERLLTAHLHYHSVPWNDVVFGANLYFGPHGCANLHQPQSTNQSSLAPRCSRDSTAQEQTRVQPRRRLLPASPGGSASRLALEERLDYWPSVSLLKHLQNNAMVQDRVWLAKAVRAQQFPKGGCQERGKLGAIYNAGFAATYHGMVSHFKRGLRDGVPVVLALGGFKPVYKPRDGRMFFYGGCALGSLECIFEPHSSCTALMAENASRVGRPITQEGADASLGFIYPSRTPDDDPSWVPRGFGGSTFEFIATLAGTQWQLNRDVRQAVAARRASLATLPVGAEYVGLHVRRGDSCGAGYNNASVVASGKRQCWSTSTYAALARQMCQKYGLSHIFVASDDAKIPAELRKLLPSALTVSAYSSPFAHEAKNTRRIEARLAALDRTSQKLRRAVIEVLTDIETLANSSMLVGGFLSQVFRLAFELSYFWKAYVVPFQSIDISWCWAGSWGRANVTLRGGRRSVVAC